LGTNKIKLNHTRKAAYCPKCTNGGLRASCEPISPVFSCGLALVLRETYSVLTFRIYKTVCNDPLLERFFSDIETSIPMIQIKFPSFDAKSAHPSVNLPESLPKQRGERQ
jgi:hypothetical protein